MITLAQRINIPELMDSAPLSRKELGDTLRFLSFAHRYLGGWATLHHYLKQWSTRWSRNEDITFLDVGTGGGDVALSLARWGRKNGFLFRITAIDSTPFIADIARETTRDYPEITVVEADFFSLDEQKARVDYVVASLFLHHMADEQLVATLRHCDALATHGIIIGDLLRSRWAYWGVGLATTVLANRVAQHDGLISVRRAFTVSELNALAAQAHLNYLKARLHPFFRTSLAGEKP